MVIARVQTQWTSHRTGLSCWVCLLLFTSTISFLPQEEKWLSVGKEVNGQPYLDDNFSFPHHLLLLSQLLFVSSLSFVWSLSLYSLCTRGQHLDVSAFTHKTRPINLCVELLPDPCIVSCNNLFLSSPNDFRLFFPRVADGVVAPAERVSPCADPVCPLSFINFSLIVFLLFFRVAHVMKEHKCHWKSDFLNLFFGGFENPTLFLYG